jgi:hypothetical protein
VTDEDLAKILGRGCVPIRNRLELAAGLTL